MRIDQNSKSANRMFRRTSSAENGIRRLKGETFRAFVHPPAAMRNVVVESGLRDTFRWRGFGWARGRMER